VEDRGRSTISEIMNQRVRWSLIGSSIVNWLGRRRVQSMTHVCKAATRGGCRRPDGSVEYRAFASW
jgi:hypothetical protein